MPEKPQPEKGNKIAPLLSSGRLLRMRTSIMMNSIQCFQKYHGVTDLLPWVWQVTASNYCVTHLHAGDLNQRDASCAQLSLKLSLLCT